MLLKFSWILNRGAYRMLLINQTACSFVIDTTGLFINLKRDTQRTGFARTSLAAKTPRDSFVVLARSGKKTYTPFMRPS